MRSITAPDIIEAVVAANIAKAPKNTPESFTVPPSEAETTKVKVTVGYGIGTTASGIELSLEQDKTIKKTNLIKF